MSRESRKGTATTALDAYEIVLRAQKQAVENKTTIFAG